MGIENLHLLKGEDMSTENAAAAANPEPTTTTEATDAAVEEVLPAEPVENAPTEAPPTPEDHPDNDTNELAPDDEVDAVVEASPVEDSGDPQ